MTVKYQRVNRRFEIPLGSNADNIAEMVRALLSMKVSVQELTLRAGNEEDGVPGEMLVDLFVPKVGPPDGELPQTDPESLWQVLSQVPLQDVTSKKRKINLDSLTVIVNMLMRASASRSRDGTSMAAVAWMVGDTSHFLKWMGVRTRNPPANFLNLPLIHMGDLPEDRLVLLCARSVTSGPLKAEWGLSTAMEIKE